MALQFRRGTDSDRLSITPAAGEPIFTSDTKELFIGDGSTTGGVDLITTKLGSVSGNIIPDADSTYDIGTPTKKFKSLYLSGSSIFLGDGLILSNDGGTFAVTDSDNTPVTISLLNNNTSGLAEGTNLYYTTARADSAAKNSISVTDVGGDGSITYNSTTGVISYTGPSASEVRAHFSAGGDLTYNSSTGQFSINVETVYSKANFDSDLGDANSGQLPEGSNLYFTDARADARITNVILDEDNMASNSATKIPSQQSVKAYVDAEVAGIVDTAPAALNTLNELAAALGDDANFSTTVTNSIGTKLTSAQTTALIDSAYVQARTTAGTDSATVISLIDSDYVQARVTASSSVTQSANAPASPSSGDMWFDTTDTSLLVYYTDSDGAQWVDISGSTGPTGAAGAAGATGPTGPTGPTGTVDSATTIALIDSAYVQARTTAGTDSAATISLIGTTVDSAYVQTRQIKYTNNDFADSAFVTTQINSVIDAAPGALDTLNELAAALGDDANFSTTITNQIAAKLDSAQAIAIIDSAYVQARTTAGTDSATVISLIDSAYVQARTTAGTDSATVISLIDSAYVQTRQVDPVSAFTTVSVTGQTDIVADADAAVPDWTSGTQQAKVIRVPFANIMSSDGFGRSPSLSTDGNYAVVGSGKNANQTRGAIHFLSRSGSTWTYGQMINRTGGAAGNIAAGFGDHMVMSNDGTIAIGAAQYEISAANASYDTGVVYLFTRTGSTWSQHSAIEPTISGQTSQGMRFGASVDISGDNQYIVIGGPGNYKGVYIYINDGSGNFSLQQKLTTSNSGIDYGGGVAIDEDGNTIVVSHQGSGSTGKIYTYVRSGTTWTLQQTIAPVGAIDVGWDDRKGKGVAISSDGNRIAFGSGGVYSTGSSIYIWNRSGTTWTQEQNITPSHTVGSGTNQVLRFGQNVSLSNDGTRLVAGTDRFNTLSHAETGITYVFTRNGSGVWSESKTLFPSDLASEDQFGHHSNISGDGTTILSMSQLADLVDGSDTYTNAGAVYAFTAPVGNPLQDTLTFEAGAGITITTNATTDTVTITGSAAGLDSASTTALIDSAYVQARQIKYTNADFTDSAYVTSQINNLIGGAPGTLDTLNEIAAALNDDDSAYSTLVGLISAKSDFDSAAAITLIDSNYVQARVTASSSVTQSATAPAGPSSGDMWFDTTDTSLLVYYTDSDGSQWVDISGSTGPTGATGPTGPTGTVDSATTIALIDSAYVQARTTAGTDSATVISLIDSSYVSARAFLSIDSDLTIVYPEQIIHSFSKTTYSTVKYIAQLKVASGYHAEELLLTHNGTNIAITSYAKLLLDSDLGIFDAQINGSNVELTLTPTKANTNVKLKAIPIAP